MMCSNISLPVIVAVCVKVFELQSHVPYEIRRPAIFRQDAVDYPILNTLAGVI